ncbi:MAG: hypothetical protein AAGH40_08550 [Verrucomicrobiota bacterium]
MTEIGRKENADPKSLLGLIAARWAGRFLGLILIIWAVSIFAKSNASAFESFKAIYITLYGMLLIAPFQKLKDSIWKVSYGALVILSAGFVFLMIAAVMFAYMAAAERGERLGVPGREGTMIFVALMQVPVVLFQRKPDLMD